MGEDRSEEIKQELMKDKNTVFENQLELAKDVLYFDNEGRGHPDVERSNLTNDQAVYLSIVGFWFAHEAGVREEDTVTSGEVAATTGIGKKTVRASVSNLKEQGLVEAPSRGHYRAVYGRIEDGLQDIRKDVSNDG